MKEKRMEERKIMKSFVKDKHSPVHHFVKNRRILSRYEKSRKIQWSLRESVKKIKYVGRRIT